MREDTIPSTFAYHDKPYLDRVHRMVNEETPNNALLAPARQNCMRSGSPSASRRRQGRTTIPTLRRLAAVNADVGPVKRGDRHRTRLSKSPR